MAAFKLKYHNCPKLESYCYDSSENESPSFKYAGPPFVLSEYCHFYTSSVSVVSVRKDSMISLGGHEENQWSDVMGNKYNICTFLLIKYQKCSLYPRL